MRPALVAAVTLAVGIAAAEWLRPHPIVAMVAVFVCASWVLLTRRRLTVALLACGVALGALLHAYNQTAGRGDLAAWAGQKVTVVGTVVGEPELRKPSGVGYMVNAERVDGHAAAGKLYVTQSGDGAPGFGERVEVRGTFKEPVGARTPGGFDRAAYLARQGVYYTLDTSNARRLGPGDVGFIRRAAVAVRLKLEGVLKGTLPQRDAALLAGLLFGSRTDLPADLKDAFKMSGVLHLLAVSGGNLAMILMPLLMLLRRLGVPKRVAAGVAIPLVVFFVFLTGAGPSVTRAGLMAVLVLLGQVLRREKDVVNTLGAAVAILLLCAPGLVFDAGLQLSVAATLGILLFSRRIEEWLAPRFQPYLGERFGKWAATGLSATLGAQALVEPVSLHHFGATSLIAPLANLLVLVVLDPLVKVGMTAALLGACWLPLAKLLSLLLRAQLWILVFLVKATSAIPFAYLEVGRLPIAGMITWYAAVALVAFPTSRQKLWERLQPLRPKAGVAAALLALALVAATGVTWRLALAAPPDTLRVSFLDIGQGDAMVVEAPNGQVAIVDAGPFVPGDPRTGRPGYDAGVEVVLPYLESRGIRRVDYLVLTHPDMDHAGAGASILAGITVGTVLKSDQNPTEKKYLEALQTAARKGVPVLSPVAGQQVRMGNEVVLEVLNPPLKRYQGTRSDDNSNCIAFRLRYRQISMILACDLEGDVEEQLVAQGTPLRADLLKAAHHGSGHSTTPAFLRAVGPTYAVLSVGNGNRYGHPHPTILERLTGAGVQIYRTDRNGTVTATTDGLSLTVRGARGGPADAHYRPLGLLGRRLFFAW